MLKCSVGEMHVSIYNLSDIEALNLPNLREYYPNIGIWRTSQDVRTIVYPQIEFTYIVDERTLVKNKAGWGSFQLDQFEVQ